MKKQKTNVQVVRELMEHGKHGALNQAFVMCALQHYCKKVIETPIEQLDTGFISGQLWADIAKEIQQAIEKHFKGEK